MSEIEQQFYRQLKNKVSERVRENHIVSSNRIEDWKGKDIEKLNIDLAERVKGRISEKWFYTHLKVENEKLPRIDMLDMLSEYVGFDNWLDFREKNKKAKKKSWGIIILAICVVMGITIWTSINLFGEAFKSDFTYQFCFVSEDNSELIGGQPIEIVMTNIGESPSVIKCDSTGCFSYVSDTSYIEFVVKMPYYYTETIKRNISTRLKR